MISSKLEEARTYEKSNMALVTKEERPCFHATGGIGWINDPNGFSLYKEEYHLFYQYHPFSTNWGPMHWGHLKTKDFVTWERLPIALAPDEEYDNFGCFSGTGLELKDGRHLLVYTSVQQRKVSEDKTEEFQQQSIAIGDGVNYEKLECNPVIRTSQIPQGDSIYDFRDPKIYEKDGWYYVLVANRAADGSGQILRYKSKNLESFEYDGILAKCSNEYGKMWECPDYFTLDGKQVLMFSPQEMPVMGDEFVKENETMFFIGQEIDGQMKKEQVQACDYGTDFYAPQTLLSTDGRRIQIAWMQAWESSNFGHEGKKIYGAMTIPRELTYKNGRIYSLPVSELKNYYKETIRYDSCKIGKCPTSYDQIYGRVFDMDLRVNGDYKNFVVKLALDEKHETAIIINKMDKTITLDRTNCGMEKGILATRTFSIEDMDDLKLRILMDKNSIELFVNEGMKSATMQIYTEINADGITFEAEGQASLDVCFHTFNF